MSGEAYLPALGLSEVGCKLRGHIGQRVPIEVKDNSAAINLDQLTDQVAEFA